MADMEVIKGIADPNMRAQAMSEMVQKYRGMNIGPEAFQAPTFEPSGEHLPPSVKTSPTGEVLSKTYAPAETAQTRMQQGWFDQLTGAREGGAPQAGGVPQIEGYEASFNLGPISLQPKAKPAASERTKIAEYEGSIGALNNLLELFDPSFVGPVTGRLAPTTGLLGMTSAEQEQFMAATSAFKNAIIKQITGAAMGEDEAQRILKQVPEITDPPARWKAKWQESKKNVVMLRDMQLDVMRRSGVQPIKAPTPVAPIQSAAQTKPNRPPVDPNDILGIR
jgi:hypothetical protein